MGTPEKPDILIVDDEASILDMLEKMLVNSGYSVRTASSVDKALEIMSQQAFNLLITDYLMPERSGFDLIIESSKLYPDTVTILFTGVGTRDLYREAINKGNVFSVIEKPFTSENLLRTIKRAISQHFQTIEDKREIKRIREQYHILFDKTTDLIQCVTTEGRFIYVNQAWYNVLGYEQGDLQALRVNDIILIEYHGHISRIIEKIKAGNPIEPFEVTMVSSDSSHIFLEGTATGQFQDNELVTVTFLFRDITERKKAAAELKARLRHESMIARIANLLANTDEPITAFPSILSIIGESTRIDMAHICSMNDDSVTEISTWRSPAIDSAHEADPSSLFACPYIRDRITREDMILLDDSSSISDNMPEFNGGSGSRAVLIFPIHIGRVPAGIIGFLGPEEGAVWEDTEIALLRAGVDIIANAWRRQHEIDIRKQKEAEAEQSGLLVIRADRLAAIGTMTAGIIHEITQPLNAINVSAQTILYGLEHGWQLESAQINSSLNLIVDQIHRMSNIIKNMRAFARDGSRAVKEKDNLNTQVNRVLSMIGEQLKAHNIEIELDLGDLPDMEMNTQQILQVILNLVTNARQALDESEVEKKKVELSTHADDTSVEFVVSDNGPGIDESLHERIFDPFFTTKEVGQGTGLGLSISAGFVQDHGGTMDYHNNEGGGVTFTMRLPLKQQQ